MLYINILCGLMIIIAWHLTLAIVLIIDYWILERIRQNVYIRDIITRWCSGENVQR